MTESSGPIPARILEELSRRVGELVPPEAAAHLMRAQRELVLALTALVQHNTRKGGRTTASGRRSSASRTRRPRHVTID